MPLVQHDEEVISDDNFLKDEHLTLLFMVLPFPICPSRPYPQLNSSPDAARARVWKSPVAIATTGPKLLLEFPSPSTGQGLYMIVISSDNCILHIIRPTQYLLFSSNICDADSPIPRRAPAIHHSVLSQQHGVVPAQGDGLHSRH